MTKVDGVFLTPGAGSSVDHPSLRAIEAELADDLPVVRHDFPYRREGRKAPDRAPKAIADIVEHAPGPGWVLGGRSFGGRMCSMAVADGLPAAGLILICYPLHPPGKPDALRTEHLSRIEVPCLFVSGTKDAFGTPEELSAAIALIPAPVAYVKVEGKDHSLKGSDAFIAATVADWVRRLRGSSPRARGGRSRGTS
jgi:predicted alpha/beta-hydrolase family hydrolase